MLKRYILAGKGIGLKWLFLILILVFGLSFCGMNYLVKQVFSTPEMTDFFQKFPKISIQDDKIVAPENTYVRQTVPVLPFSAVILDTMEKQEVKLDFSEGIYLTPTTAYIKNGTDVSYISYKDILNGRALTVTPELIKAFVTQLLTLSIGGSLILFLLITYFSIGFFSYILLCIFGRKFPFKTCLRASVVTAPIVLLLLVGLFSFQIAVPISWVMMGAIILVTYWLFVNYGWVKAVQGIDETLKELNLQKLPEQPAQMEELDDLPIIQEDELENVEVHPEPKKSVPAKKSAPKKKVQPERPASKKVSVRPKKVPAKKTTKSTKKA